MLNRARSVAFSRTERMSELTYVRGEGGLATLSARISAMTTDEGSYRTSVTIDERAATLRRASCTCPAADRGGICKHAAALVLRFNRAPGQFAGYAHRRFEGTTLALADYMRQQDVRRAEREALRASSLAGEDGSRPDLPPGSVDLEPTLEASWRSWGVQFRVTGPTSSYVLKDVRAFAADMREGAWRSYGKKLAFTHVPAVLTEHGRAMYDFVSQCLAARDAQAPAYGGEGRVFGAGSQARPASVARTLSLSEAQVADLLDVQGAVPFSFGEETSAGHLVIPAHAEPGDPALDVRVVPFDDGGCRGYLIRHEGRPLRFVQGQHSTYAQVGPVFYRVSDALAAARGFVELVFSSREQELFVDEADRDLFCRTVLPLLGQGQGVPASVPDDLDALRPVPCHLEFYLDRHEGVLTCDAVAAYGHRRVSVAGGPSHDEPEAQGPEAPDAAAATLPSARLPMPPRDEGTEAFAEQLVGRYFALDERRASSPALAVKDADGVGRLLGEGLAALRAAGEVFTTPAFDSLVVPRPPKVRVGLSVKSGLIELSALAEEVPVSEVSAVLASYRRKKRFHRLKDGTYLDLTQADLSELDEVASSLALTSAQLDAGHVLVPAYHAFHLDAVVADEDKDEDFAAFLEDFRAVDASRYQVPACLDGVLRPYQVEGFRWLCAASDKGFGGILADEMGLGKSVQLISYLLAHRDEAREVGPSLIVCPASLVYNWQAEFARFAPQMSVGVVAGDPVQRARTRGRAAWVGRGTPRADAYEVLVTSYDLLRRDAEAYEGLPFFCQVLDEAQYIKNHATKVAQAVKRVSARHRFALTGTPIENRLSELWSIFDFLMPGILGTYRRFQQRYEQPILDGDAHAASALSALVAPFILRRLKSDVLRDLPDKLDNVLLVQLEGEQRRLYAAQEQRLRASVAKSGDAEFRTGKIQVLAELTRLRQLCCDPRLLYEDAPDASAKLGAIEELVLACRDEGSKALVFSQFTSFLDLIAQRLSADGVPYYVITGATPKKRRLELVDAFNADDTPVFLISLKAGNTGLNLTGASVVIHADPWWNAAAQNQATDRAHRIGQTRVVSVYQVVAKDTVEERILRLQQAKSDLAEQFVGAAGETSSIMASLTKDDLLDLLG